MIGFISYVFEFICLELDRWFYVDKMQVYKICIFYLNLFCVGYAFAGKDICDMTHV